MKSLLARPQMYTVHCLSVNILHMNKNTVWILLALIVALIAIFALVKPRQERVDRQASSPTSVSQDSNDRTGSGSAISTDVNVGVTAHTASVTVSGGAYYLKPNVIRVREGDTVAITFKNDGGLHDLKIDGYNVITKRLSVAGETDTISFVANKKGSFDYYCTVGEHRQMGMKGTLIVE